MVEERVDGPLKPLMARGLQLGYCAHSGHVDVRLAAQSVSGLELVDEAVAIVRDRLGSFVYTDAEESIEISVLKMLSQRKQTLALAESCTGGCIANRFTNVPGASAVLLAGLVTYSNEAKKKFLGVLEETIQEHGAVSEPVAREMADGARKETGADYAIAVTGIAGPSGGSDLKPVGTVFIALAGPKKTTVERNFNPYDRETFKQVTAQQAFDLLRRELNASEN
jgi:nicotinamide-nucleotide amidase